MWKSLFDSIDRHLPTFRPATIFDVGANVGEVSSALSSKYPDAIIHAFEPEPASYAKLASHLSSCSLARCHKLALSRKTSSVFLQVEVDSKLSKIVSSPQPGAKTVAAAAISGDDFCSQGAVDAVDLLKIDTEGHDLEVLCGFSEMLNSQRVGLIDVEAGIAVDNTKHVPFVELQRFLAPKGYQVFWLHERALDLYFSGRPLLRRVNAVFISDALVNENAVQRQFSRKWESS